MVCNKIKKEEPAKTIAPLQRGKTIYELKSVVENKKHGVVRTRVTTGNCVT